MIFVKICAKQTDILIVQVYMPTTDHGDDETAKTYDEISDILHQEGKDQMNAIVVENFNSIVGDGSTSKVLGPFGLGTKNERDKIDINFYR